MKTTYLTLLVGLLSLSAQAATITGVVKTKNEPIIGAEIFWQNTTVGSTSNLDGSFQINTVTNSDTLVVRYLGFNTQYIHIDNPQKPLQINLTETKQNLDEVEVTARALGTITSRITPIQTQTITAAELCKAACCNLSESFETNASVDVAYSDAATGAKQIRLLGLSGTYVQLLTENTPGIRGLASNFGLEYIPGPWMESIQVSKGTSSVINGYEATTGQINVEYLKPQKANPIALNLFMNSEFRTEVNATGGWNINNKLSTGVMAHYKNEGMEMDANHDGFMDLPKSNQINLLNRWNYQSGNYTGQILVRGLYDERRGGQMSKLALANPYTINIDTKRIDAFMKNGYVFDPEKGTSIGVIVSGSYHEQTGLYGERLYHGAQTNLYANAIFQTNFNDHHKLVTGASVNYDNYDEGLQLSNITNEMPFDRAEVTPGVFAEYSFTFHEHLSLLAGIRGDYSSRYGFFVTPRVNMRYAPWKWWNIRASVGLGYRSPNVLADYAFTLPSSRKIMFADTEFKQEKALNTGISTTFYIPIGSRELQFSAEYYHTNFFEAVVADMDSDPHQIIFSNLNGGKAYANNFQTELSMEILRGWTTTVAYRMTDVKNTYNGTLREKPLTNRFKGLITTSYQTPLKKWQFDVTAQFNGGGRMPDPDTNNPLWASTFDAYPVLMAQITRYFKTWSVYFGGENITNFTQKNPIIDAGNPYGNNFDASMAWGPIHGAKVYIGFRWALDKPEN